MSHNAPAVEPDAFRADHDAALHHQPGSPAARLTAEQPQLDNIAIVLR
jgi:hypothetical protein